MKNYKEFANDSFFKDLNYKFKFNNLLYKGKKYKLYFEEDYLIIVKNEKIIFYCQVSFNKRLQRFILGKRENISSDNTDKSGLISFTASLIRDFESLDSMFVSSRMY